MRSTHRLWAPALLALALSTAAYAAPAPKTLYLGADLSYVNEMEECGVQYRENGVVKDPFELFHTHGANLVRVRLWNDARWTKYSDLSDVKKTIRRARAQGMQVLLDLHYSDDWADGEKQLIPKAWASITDTDELARTLYGFTYDTLSALDRAGLMPELVQVGNESNSDLMDSIPWDKKRPIDWQRNAKLFNAGIKAVRDISARSAIKPRVMLHIAQPENVEPWFAAATKAGVTDFDLIGISYYRKWSTQSMAELGKTIKRLRSRFDADVVVVETAYPWTLASGDTSHNLLGEDSLIAGYPATPQGQARYMVDLTQLVIDTGGAGVVYWEPAWTSSSCKTRWGTGSSWENASFFDFQHNNEVLPAIDFMHHPYTGVPASHQPEAGKPNVDTRGDAADNKRTQP
ncbi:glycoside hydrolase family 53 protein [Xanthomonas campestris]|uniref:glycoside hydrolase family 53 protein n=1 Tax=Xanthomonas campestris TaxID=339 RepID=UPI0023680B24|nr:arabinogalactan endo-1,4-beta-galactosidase [Xanthomonas campestris]MEA0735070.1 arabinogalactan endo-1,4-beta-galactosidase [Xanthomonas campestris pv. campestris]MEA9788443.1 arabinogalactan endo-1,4-beta-galactosidase [Xanthomonas campestris pv. raphani]WDI94938.1 arabinogalactan endo-1,4-beta-galactosidase [Xanthomonas campestris]